MALTVLLLVAQAAEAQEICYAYDRLGRLIAVVDQQGRTAIYDYDAVGNTLAIRRNDATGPLAITLVNPSEAVPGEQMEILGTGFSGIVVQNQVAIGGVSGTVLGASNCRLTIRVPDGVPPGSVAISVTTPLGSAVSGQPFLVVNMFISPTQAAQLVGTSRLFAATILGSDDQRVIMSVNGLDGGNAIFGTITPGGIYTAPGRVPIPATVRIEARSIRFAELFAEATVTIVSELNRFADAPPVSVAFGPPRPGAITSAPVSVNFGPPPPGTIVSPAVSVFFGVPPANVFARAVSVANAPVITAILDPKSAAPGTTLTLTLTGDNFTGTTALVFSLQGRPDADLSVASLTVSPGGDRLTADVTVGATAAIGPRIVIVKTPSGNSTGANTGNNIFTVTAP